MTRPHGSHCTDQSCTRIPWRRAGAWRMSCARGRPLGVACLQPGCTALYLRVQHRTGCAVLGTPGCGKWVTCIAMLMCVARGNGHDASSEARKGTRTAAVPESVLYVSLPGARPTAPHLRNRRGTQPISKACTCGPHAAVNAVQYCTASARTGTATVTCTTSTWHTVQGPCEWSSRLDVLCTSSSNCQRLDSLQSASHTVRGRACAVHCTGLYRPAVWHLRAPPRLWWFTVRCVGVGT